MNCNVKRAGRLLKKYAICFCLTLLVFVVSMTLVFMIPNQKIEWHREYSIYMLTQIEETWESFGNLFGLHSQPGMIDNTSDRIMMRDALIPDESMSALEAAMYMNGYTRYWHGYQVFLRPLLVLYQLHQIRYLNMFCFFGVFCLVLFALKKRTGGLSAVAFFLTMVCSHIVVIPMSMQYMAVFMVTMLTMLMILLRYPFAKSENLPLLFMIIGMLINFLDLLTVPIVTLGVPLLLCLYLEQQERPESVRMIRLTVGCSVSWGIGYGLCWLSKWVLSSIVLKRSIFEEVVGRARVWAVDADHSEGRVNTLLRNIHDYFGMQGIRSMVFPVLFIMMIGVILLLFASRNRQRWIVSGVMLMVSVYPYIWYFVLMEHSWLHHWFTYRAQVVTQFGVYMSVIGLLDQNKLAEWMKHIFERFPALGKMK